MDSGYLVFPQIDPVMIKIFGLSIHWYGMMYLLAFVMAHLLANRAAAKPNSGWTKDQVGDLLFYGFLGVVLGGRVGYVLFYNFQKFVEEPTYLFKTWEGGMSFHGGVIGVLLAMAYFARRYQKNYLALGDFVVVLLPLGLGAGRIGNFINGELWGRVSDVPWAMLFPTGGTLPRHPSQLYEFFFEGIVLFIMLMLYRRQSPPAGAVAGLFLLGYGVFRFGIEFFREPDKHLGILNLGMTMGQWLCVPMIISGLFFIGWGYWRRQKGAAY